MQPSGAQSEAAHEQSSVAQPAGRGLQEYVTGQPAMQPAAPPSGQLGVSLEPAGHAPLAGTGVQASVAQLWWLTHSWAAVHSAASPHGTAASPSD